MTEDEMVGGHHRLDGHEFEQTPGDSEGQGSLMCYSPWGHKELDMTEQQQQVKTSSEVWCGSSVFTGDLSPYHSAITHLALIFLFLIEIY